MAWDDTSNVVLKSFSLTHVRYPAGSPITPILALASLAPQFIMCAYATLILARRELTWINACAAQLTNEVFNWILKRLMQIPRPDSAARLGEGGTGYGMPSSHSQFMGFFAAFFLLHLYQHRPRTPRKMFTIVTIVRRVEHYASQAFVVLLSFTTVFSRWYLGYHTAAQVWVGLALGLGVGTGWWYLSENLARRQVYLPFDLGVRPRYLFPLPPAQRLTRHDSGASATLAFSVLARRSSSESDTSDRSIQSLVSAPADVPSPRPGAASPTPSHGSADTHTPPPATPPQTGTFDDPFHPSDTTRAAQVVHQSPLRSPKGSLRTSFDWAAPVDPPETPDVLALASHSHTPGSESIDGPKNIELSAKRLHPRTRFPVPALRHLILDHPISIALRLRDSYHVWHDGGLEADYSHWRIEYEKKRTWEWDDRDAEDIRPQEQEGPPRYAPHPFHPLPVPHKHRPIHSSHTSSRLPSREPSRPPSRLPSRRPSHAASPREPSKAASEEISRPPTQQAIRAYGTRSPRAATAYAPGTVYSRALVEKLTKRRGTSSALSSSPVLSRTPSPAFSPLERPGPATNTAPTGSPESESGATFPRSASPSETTKESAPTGITVTTATDKATATPTATATVTKPTGSTNRPVPRLVAPTPRFAAVVTVASEAEAGEDDQDDEDSSPSATTSSPAPSGATTAATAGPSSSLLPLAAPISSSLAPEIPLTSPTSWVAAGHLNFNSAGATTATTTDDDDEQLERRQPARSPPSSVPSEVPRPPLTTSSLDLTSLSTMPWESLPSDEQVAHSLCMIDSLRLANQCDATSTAFCVGCVVRPRYPASDALGLRALVTGFSREIPGNTHAEQCALDKLAAKLQSDPATLEDGSTNSIEDLNLDLYTTMEPCSERLSGALPCMQRIIAFNEHPPIVRHSVLSRLLGLPISKDSIPVKQYRLCITRVLQGVSEPEDFVQCVGATTLREHGVQVLTVRPHVPHTMLQGSNWSWLEQECLRIAKHGHADQPAPALGVEALWKA